MMLRKLVRLACVSGVLCMAPVGVAEAQTEISGNWVGTDNQGFAIKVDIKSSFRRGLTGGHIRITRHISFPDHKVVLRYRGRTGKRWNFDLPHSPSYTVTLKRDGSQLRVSVRYMFEFQRSSLMNRA